MIEDGLSDFCCVKLNACTAVGLLVPPFVFTQGSYVCGNRFASRWVPFMFRNNIWVPSDIKYTYPLTVPSWYILLRSTEFLTGIASIIPSLLSWPTTLHTREIVSPLKFNMGILTYQKGKQRVPSHACVEGRRKRVSRRRLNCFCIEILFHHFCVLSFSSTTTSLVFKILTLCISV